MRNSICILSFIICRIILKKMCVRSDRFGVYFFAKRVRILMKVFKTSMPFFFMFSRLQCLQSLHLQDFNIFSLYISRLQGLQSLHFQNFNVFFLYISKTLMSFVFIFQDFNVSYFCYCIRGYIYIHEVFLKSLISLSLKFSLPSLKTYFWDRKPMGWIVGEFFFSKDSVCALQSRLIISFPNLFFPCTYCMI